MKIQRVSYVNFNPNWKNSEQQTNSGEIQLAHTVFNLNNIPYIHPITFSGIQNSSKLRALFPYRLPCIYSGLPTIDPKVLNRWMKSNIFVRPAQEVLNIIKPYEDSFAGLELKVIEILKERAKIHPDKSMKQLLEELKPVYARRLRKKQTPVFHELAEYFQTLPNQYNTKFKRLMEDTEKKLNERPVFVPFSSYEFKYKLGKIANDIENGSDLKAKKVMRKLLKESKRFSNTTSASTTERQKEVLKFLKLILRKSVLKNNERLNELMNVSQSRLNKDEIVVSFSRKSFIYDLLKIVEDIHDEDIHADIFNIVNKLPTSQESFSAYMLKITAETPDKISHRIIWPYLASVEHLLPRSKGGLDLMENFACATTRENSDRKSIEFTEQMKRRKNTPQNCQLYIDKLIELYKEGVFSKIGLSPRYITDFKDTIYRLSKHRIKLDTSALEQ